MKYFIWICLINLLLVNTYADDLHDRHFARADHGDQSSKCSNCTDLKSSISKLITSSAIDANSLSVTKSTMDTIEKEFIFKPNYKVLEYRGGFNTSFSIPVPSNLLDSNSLVFEYSSQNFLRSNYGIGFELNLPRIQKDIILSKIYLNIGHNRHEFVGYTGDGVKVSSRILKLTGGKILKQFRLRNESNFWHLVELQSSTYKYALLKTNGHVLLFDKLGRMVQKVDIHGNKLEYIYSGCNISRITNDDWSMTFEYDPRKGEHYKYGYKCNNDILKSVDYNSRKISFDYSYDFFLSDVRVIGSKKSIFKATYAKPNIEEKFYSNESYEKDHVYIAWEKGIKKFNTKISKYAYHFYLDITGDGLADKVEFNLKDYNKSERKLFDQGAVSYVKFSPLEVNDGKFRFVEQNNDSVLNNQQVFQSKLLSSDINDTEYKNHEWKNHYFDLNNDGKKEYFRCHNVNDTIPKLVKGDSTFTSVVDYKLHRNHFKQSNKIINFIPHTVKYKAIDLGLRDCGKAQLIDLNLDGYIDVVVNSKKVYFGSLSGFHERNLSPGEIKNIYGFDVDDEEESVIWLSLESNLKYKKYSKLQFVKSLVSGDYYKVDSKHTVFSHPDIEKMVISELNSDWSGNYKLKYSLKNGVIVVSNLKILESSDNYVNFDYKYSKINIDPFYFYNLGFSKIEINKDTITPFKDKRIQKVKTIKEYSQDLEADAFLYNIRPSYAGSLKFKETYVDDKYKRSEKYKYEYVKLSPNRYYMSTNTVIHYKESIDSPYPYNKHFTPINLNSDYWYTDSSNNYLVPKVKEAHRGKPQDMNLVFSNGSDKHFIKKTSYKYNPTNYLHKSFMVEETDSFKKKIKLPVVNDLDANTYATLKTVSGENQTIYEYDNLGRLVFQSDGKGHDLKYENFINNTNVAKKMMDSYKGSLKIHSFDTFYNKVTKIEDYHGNNFEIKLFPWGGFKEVYKNDVLLKSRAIDFSSHEIEEFTNGHNQKFKLNNLGYVVGQIYELPNISFNKKLFKGADGYAYRSEIGQSVVDYKRHFNGEILETKSQDSTFKNVRDPFTRFEYIDDILITQEDFYSDGTLKNILHGGDDYSVELDNLKRLKKFITNNEQVHTLVKRDIQGRVIKYLRGIPNDPLNKVIEVLNTFNDKENVIENSLGASFKFRSDGMLLSYKDNNSSVTNSYELNKLTTKDINSVKNKISIKNNYDNTGILSSIEHEYGKINSLKKAVEKFTYDSYENLKSYELNDLKEDYFYKNGIISKISPYISKVLYNDLGKISRVIYTNGSSQVIEYNFSGNIIGKKLILNNKIHSYDVEYKLNKYLTNETLSSKVSVSKSYDYKIAQDGVKLIIDHAQSLMRSNVGNVLNVNELDLKFSAANLTQIGDKSVVYDDSAKGLLFLDKDISVYRIGSSLIKNNKVIRKIKLKDITFGYVIGENFYPSLTDLRDSPVIVSEASDVLFIREYNEFGDYKLHCYTGCELDNDLLFGFSHMIKPFKDLDLHWSNSRVYSASLKQWLSLDPMLYWNIDSFLKLPENWHGYKYCDDDPVNCVDPSGYAAGDIYLYEGNGTFSSNIAIFGQDMQLSVGRNGKNYSHASIDIGNGQVFSSTAGTGNSYFDKSQDIMSHRASVDIFRHSNSNNFDVNRARDLANSKVNASRNLYIFDGVCSTATKDAAIAGGLNIDASGPIMTAPNDISNDSSLQNIGRYDYEQQMSIEY